MRGCSSLDSRKPRLKSIVTSTIYSISVSMWRGIALHLFAKYDKHSSGGPRRLHLEYDIIVLKSKFSRRQVAAVCGLLWSQRSSKMAFLLKLGAFASSTTIWRDMSLQSCTVYWFSIIGEHASSSFVKYSKRREAFVE